MYKYFFFFLFLTTKLVAQDTISLRIKDDDTSENLEYVLIKNISYENFNYSNNKGKSEIEFKELSDTIEISIPSYIPIKTTINSILERNNKVRLNKKTEYLEEVVIISKAIPKFYKKIEFKQKKKYFTQLISTDASMVSSYQNKCKDCTLVGIKFIFDNSILEDGDELKIRPLLLNKNLDYLIEYQKAITINNQTNNVIINLSSNPIKLRKKSIFYFGFEIINENNFSKKIKVRVLNKKKTYTLIKSNPNKKWYKQDNYGSGFTMDYELFINKEDNK